MGRPTSLTGTKAGEIARTYVSQATYDAGGGVDQMGLGNGKWEDWEYNERKQVIAVKLGSTLSAAPTNKRQPAQPEHVPPIGGLCRYPELWLRRSEPDQFDNRGIGLPQFCPQCDCQQPRLGTGQLYTGFDAQDGLLEVVIPTADAVRNVDDFLFYFDYESLAPVPG